jgi:hypothetical protein
VQAGGGISVREAHEQTQAELREVQRVQGEKHPEVIARFGRNDTPEAMRVMGPIWNRSKQLRAHLEQLLCRDRPVSRPRDELKSRRIRFERKWRVDRRSVDAYVDAKQRDGAIGGARAADLRFVLSQAGRGVMNPSSMGAGTINRRIAQALECFGLFGPPRSAMRPKPPPRPPRPKPVVRTGPRFFRTCGDAVCSGYRGPTPGVPLCAGARQGDGCRPLGVRCDLQNNCNMHLICATRDPSTRCPR